MWRAALPMSANILKTHYLKSFGHGVVPAVPPGRAHPTQRIFGSQLGAALTRWRALALAIEVDLLGSPVHGLRAAERRVRSRRGLRRQRIWETYAAGARFSPSQRSRSHRGAKSWASRAGSSRGGPSCMAEAGSLNERSPFFPFFMCEFLVEHVTCHECFQYKKYDKNWKWSTRSCYELLTAPSTIGQAF